MNQNVAARVCEDPGERDGLLGVVLAGGRSSRMGRDKASLLRPDGTTFLAHALDLLRPFCAEVLVSVRAGAPLPPAAAGRAVIVDETPEVGPLGGILTCLARASRSGLAGLVSLSCDLPLLTLAPLQRLVAAWRQGRGQTGPGDTGPLAVAFRDGAGRLQPLVCVWSCEALPLLQRALYSGDYSLRRALPDTAWQVLDCLDGEERLLANVNAPEDLDLLFQEGERGKA